MTNRRRNPYSGHPILGKRPNCPLTNEEVHQRLVALCEYHGIADPENDPMALAKLAFCLAKHHVPGMQPTRPGGRPPKRTISDMTFALMQFCGFQRETGECDSVVIKKMAEDDLWREWGFGNTVRKRNDTLRYIMQRVNEADIAPKIDREISNYMAAFAEILKSDEEARKRVQKKLGPNSKEWASLEAMLSRAQ
jgi:hypothetical protein